MHINVLIIDFFHDEVIQKLRSIPSLKIDYYLNLNEAQVLDKLGDVSILILRTSYTITSEWLNKAKSLKMIIVGGNGTNHIPIKELEARNILLKNVKNASVNAVAEYGVCLILMGLRKVFNAITGLQNGNWLKNELIGRELHNKQVGLIGFGEIGQAIAHKLNCFGASIVYYDPIVNHKNFIKKSLEEILSKSDIISIQVPLNKSTTSLIDSDCLFKLKKNALMINLSRYEVLNIDHLYSFLMDTDKSPYFFIDPLEKKHIKEVQKFKDLPVTFSPHIGANTLETQLRIGEEITTIIKSFVKVKAH